MSQRRSQKAQKQPTLWGRLLAWRPNWRPASPRREVVGGVLLVLAALTVLGLSRISSGAVLGWWATLLRRLFGWGSYPLTVGMGVWGLLLVWRELQQKLALGLRTVVGLELLFAALLLAFHAPLVLQDVDEALQAAQAGRAGGYVGWSLAALLFRSLGVFAGSAVLLVTLVVALLLVLPLSRGDLKTWIRGQRRMVVAAWSRWQTARKGRPVEPELPEVPWWEQEPEPAKPDVQPKAPARQRRQTAPRARKQPGDRPRGDNLPPLDLLDPVVPHAYGEADIRAKTRIIEETLVSFGVPASVVEINQGPTVTQFGLDPGFVERRISGGDVMRHRVRVARIASLVDDLALALAAAPIRIEAPVPGKSVVGLEVPNEQVSLVSLRAVMESPQFTAIGSRLAIALGENVSGEPVAGDLAVLPHLLIAGATGSGKSVCVNAVICCLLFNNHPDELRMLMVDPKMVELVGYNDIPHLLAPVVVDAEQVVNALAWVTAQMDERYRLFHQAGARNLEDYNRRAARRKGDEPLPTLVILIDELADLMMVAADDVERHICRLAQMGRATGIHLVVATQRPSVDVVTGLIKANFPARISFAVSSQVDSRVILDQVGAEKLLGRGDMLFQAPDQAAPIRLQGCFVSDHEIDQLASFWRSHRQVTEQAELFPPWAAVGGQPEADAMLEKAIKVVEGRQRVSTSFLQRRLRIGFPRAARLIDQLEDRGIVGEDEGGGRGRQVLLGKGIDFDEIDERLPGVEPK
jgi:S-DNA-T family DNA segregation ATPase FtsK/SpoIIIE